MRHRTWRYFIAIATIAVAAVGWSTLLYPPVEFYLSKPNVGFWDTLTELLKPTNAVFPEGYGVGWLFLASGMTLGIAVPLALLQLLGAALRYIEASEATISVLETKFSLHFEDEDLSRSTLSREQLFHANRPGVASLPYSHSVNAPAGEIVQKSFNMCTYIKGEKITSHVMEDYDRRHIEAIEVLCKNLPTSIMATYLPDWIVMILFNHTSILDSIVAERLGEIRHINEFNSDRARLEFRTDKFATKNMSVTISFPLAAFDRVEDLKCYIIHRHAVSEVHPRSTIEGDRRLISVYVARLSQEVMRIQWTPPAKPSPDATASVAPTLRGPTRERKGLWKSLRNKVGRKRK